MIYLMLSMLIIAILLGLYEEYYSTKIVEERCNLIFGVGKWQFNETNVRTLPFFSPVQTWECVGVEE